MSSITIFKLALKIILILVSIYIAKSGNQKRKRELRKYREALYNLDYTAALEHINVFITAHPKDHHAYNYKAEILLKLENNSESIIALQNSIRYKKRQYDAYKLLADVYYNDKQYDLSIAMFDKAIKVKKDPLAYYNRGIAYSAIDEIGRGISDVKTALKKYKGDKEFIYKELGYLYQLKGDHIKSEQYYDMIMKTPA